MSDFDFKTTSFEFKGFAEMYRVLQKLPEVALKKELEPDLVASLQPMKEFARIMAPNDPLTAPPYSLPESIEVSTRQRTGRAKSDRALGKYDARAYIGPTGGGYPQAMFAEFGTTQRSWKEPGPTKSTGLMVATPYMRPAWDSEKETALKILAARFEDRLHMTARRYGPKG